MRSIVVREFGGPDQLKLEERPDPAPGPGQVRVRIHAVGVNPFDTYQLTGNYAFKPQLPYTPGADAAGVVEQVGPGVTTAKAGDRVYIGGTAQHRSWGAYASMAVCDLHQIHALADRVSFAQGAAVNVPYVTAWRALFDRARCRPGETVLVHGASGAVGIAATQIGRGFGAVMIGTAGTPEGLALVKAQGAQHAVNHRDADAFEQIAKLTDGRGPDVVIEMLANVNLDRDLGLVAPGGRIVVVGNRGRIEIDPRKAMGRDAAILGMSMWNIPADELARIHAGLVAGLESGVLTPVVAAEMPLADAARAHRMVMEPGAKGKIVLVP